MPSCHHALVYAREGSAIPWSFASDLHALTSLAAPCLFPDVSSPGNMCFSLAVRCPSVVKRVDQLPQLNRRTIKAREREGGSPGCSERARFISSIPFPRYVQSIASHCLTSHSFHFLSHVLIAAHRLRRTRTSPQLSFFYNTELHTLHHIWSRAFSTLTLSLNTHRRSCTFTFGTCNTIHTIGTHTPRHSFT